MQKVISVLALLLALPLLAQAQEAPRIEAFGGYSYLRLDQDTNAVTTGDQDLNGFTTNFTYNLNSVLGITADISGNFSNSLSSTTNTNSQDTYYFLFGPKFAFRGNERFTPFAHVLLGFVRQDISAASQAATASNSTNQKQFAMAIGGGLDVNLTEKIAFRPVQADLILTRLNTNNVATAGTAGTTTSSNQYNFRASTGIVVKLGEQ
jgi:opacity protein-like surface antigen